jgi:hypothetical protein
MGKGRGVLLKSFIPDSLLDLYRQGVSWVLLLTPLCFFYKPSHWLAWILGLQFQNRLFRSLPGYCLVSWWLHRLLSWQGLFPRHYSIRLSQKLIIIGQRWIMCDYWSWGVQHFSMFKDFPSLPSGVSSCQGVGVYMTSRDTLLTTSIIWILLYDILRIYRYMFSF